MSPLPAAIRRLAVATAVVVTAGLLATGTAAATDPAATSLSIRSALASIDPGGTDTVSGVLDAGGTPLAGQSVELDSRAPGGTFAALASATTGPDGAVSFAVTPGATTEYELSYAGDSADAPSTSGVVRVVVRTLTSLSIRLDVPRINAGQSATVSGVLLDASNHALSGQVVQLRARRAGTTTTWAVVRSTTTDAGGLASFAVAPRVPTYYRLAFPTTANYRRSASGVVFLFVRQVAHLTLTPAVVSINPGGSAVLRGVLSGGGSRLAGRTVTLQRHVPGTTTWTSLRSKQTGTHGGVDFTVSPSRTSTYRLVFAGGPAFLRAVSPSSTVIVRRPSSLSIRLTPSTVAPGHSVTVSGVLLGAGHVLPGRTVYLYERQAGTTTWTKVASYVTGSRGGVSFSVVPSHPKEQYFLVFRLHPYYLGCHSGIVTAIVS